MSVRGFGLIASLALLLVAADLGAQPRSPLSLPRAGLSWREVAYPHLDRYLYLIEEAWNRGQQQKKNERRRSVKLLRRAISIEPKRSEAYEVLARLYFIQKKDAKVEKTLKELGRVVRRPLSRPMIYIRALVKARKNRPHRAALMLRGLWRRDDPPKTQSAIITNAAELAMASGRLVKAAFWFRLAIKTHSKNLHARYGLSMALLADGQFTRARKAFRSLKNLDPDIKVLRDDDALFVSPFLRHLYAAALFESFGCTKVAQSHWAQFSKSTPRTPYSQTFQKYRALTKETSTPESIRSWCQKGAAALSAAR